MKRRKRRQRWKGGRRKIEKLAERVEDGEDGRNTCKKMEMKMAGKDLKEMKIKKA